MSKEFPEFLKVKFIHLPVINFALQQNRTQLIRVFTIENTSEEALHNIQIQLTAEPEFADAFPYHIETIPAGETVKISDLNLNLSPNFFIQLTERMAGHISLDILVENESVFRKKYPIDVLTFDQWAGISVMPEMLSAYITPNHPAVYTIISRASAILEQMTGNSALDEYQSRTPNQVKNQMVAIYSAVAEQNITYASSPASFEDFGQRIRLADSVLSQKMGTCLDMALLYASCLEAVGIHPLIIIMQGHAFAGAWVVPDTFSDSITDDPSFLTKRTADGINEVILLETTCMNRGNGATFDQAIQQANDAVKKTADFIFALDVKRTRFSRIRPLPQRILNGTDWKLKNNEAENTENTEINIIHHETINPYDLSNFSDEIEVTKQLIWERKLLDLSLRNNLLNTRITKNTLQLISLELDKVEDALSGGSEFRLLPKPKEWEAPQNEFGIYQSVQSSDPIIELIKTDIEQKKLHTYLSDIDLEKSLTHLYRSSRLSVEENGANTLYMALGLLRWYETAGSERPRYAPILLFPVEMIRKSAAKGYIIRSREEDAMLNITLLEMLRQNFGISIPGLEQLSQNENGVNVRLIYSIVRDCIKNKPKWDVEEEAILGIFSFNKFIMWNDIHNNADKLIENKLVRSLISGKIEFEVEESTTDAAFLDKTLTPADIVLPISADSSQLEAVYEAINDKTFILHGPPGTGKSQTITNIIANALYQGKRVLFVAEKMAALSVVQSRLQAIGLAPFCLELHSNKAKKTSVLSQLKATTEVVKHRSPENFLREANRLFELRKELNIHIDALHRPHLFGISLYQAITKYLQIENKHEIVFPLSLFENITDDKLVEWQDAIDALTSVGSAFRHPHNHPLAEINITKYSPEIREQAIAVLTEAIQIYSDLQATIPTLRSIVGDDEQTQYVEEQIDVAGTIFKVLQQIPELTPDLLHEQRPTDTLSELTEVVSRGKSRDRAKESVTQYFTDSVFDIEAKMLLNAWNIASAKWAIPRFFGQKKVRERLSAYLHNGVIGKIDIKTTLTNIIKYQDEKKTISSYSEKMQSFFGKFAKHENEQWDSIQQIIDNFLLLNDAIFNFTKDMAKANQLKTHLATQMANGMDVFRKTQQNYFVEYKRILSNVADIGADITETLGTDAIQYPPADKGWIEKSLCILKLWLSNIDLLKDWAQWLLAKRKAQDIELGFVTNAYAKQNIPTNELSSSFYKGFYRATIQYIVMQEPDLEMFKGKLFNNTIAKYKKMNDEFVELTKKELYAKLAANTPMFTIEAAQNSEVGILQRNIKSNGRGMSIRSLFDQIPTLLSRMCPCMLMSPISVAQYINPDAEKFDLIVFDEASQMPTYEAVGAIARGKNMVIVGDPKQMPPSNFFSVNSVDEDNLDKEDLESILDDSLALSIPSRYLLWHYRSKHESLIAFSNSEYYDNKLLTFPSPDNIESKVRLVPIEGFYDKGKSRQNKSEAQAVVEEIKRRLSDPILRKRSIGVVTFSSVQQTLIEDLLSNLFVKNTDIEGFALECEEPLFIKNLENVQGDERDVILFSVGYGPDSSGHVSMNFGPLNRIGGERRLNVAVSRARYEMTIFSTLRSDQIDLNRTSAIGVEGLKRFLEFAERGERISRTKQSLTNIENASIEHIIAQQLRELGHEVHTNIGTSGYKIDIGIVDVENPGNYIVGIICDGENYKRTKTTRDREVVQNSVLRMLGWKICRVWTLDWWENPNEVIHSIEIAIENIKKGVDETLAVVESEETVIKKPVKQKAETKVEDPVLPENSKEEKIYVAAKLPAQSCPADFFFYTENDDYIVEQLEDVIETEAPIAHSLLCKRMLNSWNISRPSVRVNRRVDELLKKVAHFETTNEDDSIFIWKSKEQYESFNIFRPKSKRTAEELPLEEIANAMKYLTERQVSIPRKDLLRLTVQLFGFIRTNGVVESVLEKGLQKAVENEYVRVLGDNVLV